MHHLDKIHPYGTNSSPQCDPGEYIFGIAVWRFDHRWIVGGHGHALALVGGTATDVAAVVDLAAVVDAAAGFVVEALGLYSWQTCSREAATRPDVGADEPQRS